MTLIDFGEKPSQADPVMVDHIVQSVGKALSNVIIPNVTTQADLLSAIFTILHRLLQVAKSAEAPEEHDQNSKEISKILVNFLLEFGASDVKH